MEFKKKFTTNNVSLTVELQLVKSSVISDYLIKEEESLFYNF